MSSYLSGVAEQLSMASAIFGKPSSRASVVFAGPPKADLIDVEERKLYPIGMLASITTQDSRTNITQEVIGMEEQIDYGYQKGRKIGAVTGLVLFMEDALSVVAGSSTVRTHFMKSLYAPVRAYASGKLVLPFYKGSKSQEDNSFYEPIAFDDSDKWRNFSSPFFSIPIGLYKLERSEAGINLEATYLEGVKLEGTLNLAIQPTQMGPQFEQFGFTYTKAIPMKPDLEDVVYNLETGEATTSDLSEFTNTLKAYLGITS